MKIALTKNPKRRPAAERMLFHPFVLAGDLSVRLSLELLQRVRNPESAAAAATAMAIAADDEGGVVENVPRRISSRTPSSKQKTQSELNSEYELCLIEPGKCSCLNFKKFLTLRVLYIILITIAGFLNPPLSHYCISAASSDV